jgi:hypothetical protein
MDNTEQLYFTAINSKEKRHTSWMDDEPPKFVKTLQVSHESLV